MTFKEGSDRRVRYWRVLGLVFIVAEFVMIGLAWNGAAGRACVDCQFPYLLSEVAPLSWPDVPPLRWSRLV